MTIADACLIVSTVGSLASSITMIWISLKNQTKLHAIKDQTNHMHEQLIDNARIASHAAGVTEGMARRNEGGD
jgi:hypothetical protein